MKKFRITWWEERIYRCSIDIEAEDLDEANELNMMDKEDWSEIQKKTYFEELKETTNNGHINTVEL